MSLVLENICRFIGLILLQLLLINHLQLASFCMPCLYILCLIALPVSLPRWAELLIGFCLGLIMDIMCNSLGMHTAACTAIAYARPLLVSKMIADSERLTGCLHMRDMGTGSYMRLIALLTVLYHFVYFLLEIFTWSKWWLIFVSTIVSSAICWGLIMLIEYFRENTQRNKR